MLPHERSSAEGGGDRGTAWQGRPGVALWKSGKRSEVFPAGPDPRETQLDVCLYDCAALSGGGQLGGLGARSRRTEITQVKRGGLRDPYEAARKTVEVLIEKLPAPHCDCVGVRVIVLWM